MRKCFSLLALFSLTAALCGSAGGAYAHDTDNAANKVKGPILIADRNDLEQELANVRARISRLRAELNNIGNHSWDSQRMARRQDAISKELDRLTQRESFLSNKLSQHRNHHNMNMDSDSH